jgi:hypothetical protein
MKLRLICLFLEGGSDKVVIIATRNVFDGSGFKPDFGEIFSPINIGP